MTAADQPPDTAAESELARLRAQVEVLRAELAEATRSLELWRGEALERWERTAIGFAGTAAQQELAAIQQTVSWRVTKPLRSVRRLTAPGGGG